MFDDHQVGSDEGPDRFNWPIPEVVTTRTHRIELRLRRSLQIRIEGAEIDGGTFVERSVTADVSARGAAVRLCHPVYVGDRLLLQRLGGGKIFRAVVRNVSRANGIYRVGLEFVGDPDLWPEVVEALAS